LFVSQCRDFFRVPSIIEEVGSQSIVSIYFAWIVIGLYSAFTQS